MRPVAFRYPGVVMPPLAADLAVVSSKGGDLHYSTQRFDSTPRALGCPHKPSGCGGMTAGPNSWIARVG